MKDWTYSYKTSDGLRHEGELKAATKDDAYAELRCRGIRAIRVTERITPVVRRGFGGLRKRDWTVVVLVVLVLVAGVSLLPMRGPRLASPAPDARPSPLQDIRLGDYIARPRSRCQLSAPVRVDEVFSRPFERFLARFAQPGARVDVGDLTTADMERLAADFSRALAEPIIVRAGDDPAVASLKCIVAGLKSEAEMHLIGGRSFAEYAAWLGKRQQMEADYRESILKGAGSVAEKNAKLKSLEFGLVPAAQEK